MPLLSPAVVVRCCHRPPLLLSLSAAAVVVVRHRGCPLLPSSAPAAVIATPCLHRLLPPALVRPLSSPPPNLACNCCLLLSLFTFAIVVHCRRLPPPQPLSPLPCLHRLSPPALILTHCSPPPNHSCCCRLPSSSSATIIVCRPSTSTCPPSYKMLIVAL
jgi:hypothetical protein